MNCYVRKWEIDDAPAIAAALSDIEIFDNLRDGLPFPYTEKDALDYIQAMRSANPKDTFAYAIVYEGEVVGSIGIFRKTNIHSKTAELGYYLAKKQWGKGIMTKAISEACAQVFAESDIIRIFAEPFSRNAASCRVLEKVGFSYEGTMKCNAVKNGKVEDMRIYALIRTYI